MQKHHVHLRAAERVELEALLTKGNLKARACKQITGLRALDRGQTLQAVASTLGVDYNTVARWRDNYQAQGLACLTVSMIAQIFDLSHL